MKKSTSTLMICLALAVVMIFGATAMAAPTDSTATTGQEAAIGETTDKVVDETVTEGSTAEAAGRPPRNNREAAASGQEQGNGGRKNLNNRDFEGDRESGKGGGVNVIAVAADVLGMTEDEVKEAVKDAKIGDLLVTDNKVEEFKTAYLKALKSYLDEKVTDGSATQAEADEKYAAVEEKISAYDGTASLRDVLGHDRTSGDVQESNFDGGSKTRPGRNANSGISEPDVSTDSDGAANETESTTPAVGASQVQ